ncbi:unnamed protein product [Ixodes pacificus]
MLQQPVSLRLHAHRIWRLPLQLPGRIPAHWTRALSLHASREFDPGSRKGRAGGPGDTRLRRRQRRAPGPRQGDLDRRMLLLQAQRRERTAREEGTQQRNVVSEAHPKVCSEKGNRRADDSTQEETPQVSVGRHQGDAASTPSAGAPKHP